jgi:CO/xanthine dehydrogenase FAD-binding subunit
VLTAPEATSWLGGRAAWSDTGLAIDAADLAEFGERVAEAARPIDDHRSTAAYRRRAIAVLAQRAARRATTTSAAA